MGNENVKVYVAGSSRERDRARRFVERVRGHGGMTISYDWIGGVDAAFAAGKFDSDLDNDARAEFAMRDLFDGVEACDVLVVLAEATTTGRGMWVELGFALALAHATPNGPTIIVSGGGKRSIFSAPGLVDFEVPFAVDDDEAFAILCSFADGHGAHEADGVEESRPDARERIAALEEEVTQLKATYNETGAECVRMERSLRAEKDRREALIERFAAAEEVSRLRMVALCELLRIPLPPKPPSLYESLYESEPM